MEELNICVSSVSEIVVGLGYQKRCALGGCNVIQLQWRDQGCKHVSNYLLAAKVRVMIFCTALSQGTRVGCLTMTRIEKPVIWILSPPLLPENKNSRLQLESGADWGIIHQEYVVRGTKIKSETYMKTPQRLKELLSNSSIKESWCFFNMIMWNPTLFLLCSGDSVIFEVVPRPSYSLDLAQSDLQLFAVLKKQLKGIISHVLKKFRLQWKNVW